MLATGSVTKLSYAVDTTARDETYVKLQLLKPSTPAGWRALMEITRDAERRMAEALLRESTLREAALDADA